jgi:hypothetical protein
MSPKLKNILLIVLMFVLVASTAAMAFALPRGWSLLALAPLAVLYFIAGWTQKALIDRTATVVMFFLMANAILQVMGMTEYAKSEYGPDTLREAFLWNIGVYAGARILGWLQRRFGQDAPEEQ